MVSKLQNKVALVIDQKQNDHLVNSMQLEYRQQKVFKVHIMEIREKWESMDNFFTNLPFLMKDYVEEIQENIHQGIEEMVEVAEIEECYLFLFKLKMEEKAL